jgi:hypothetical protein
VTIAPENDRTQTMTVRVMDTSPSGLGIESEVPLVVGSQVIVDHGPNARSGVPEHQSAKIAWCVPGRPGTYRAGLRLETPANNEDSEASARPADTSADYYEVLEVSRGASPDTIHRVYRILAQRYHPDNAETGDTGMFRTIVEAYRVLSDPEKRSAYDVHHEVRTRRRWQIFDSATAASGPKAEQSKRRGILALLYTKRMQEPNLPALTIAEMEDLLGCPREHLEFSLWYLRDNGHIVRSDNGRFAITVKGVDQAETTDALGFVDHLKLPAARP